MRFYANPAHPFTFANAARGYAPGGPFDCLGPFAKVVDCPIHGTDLRRTVYATGYPDTYFSIPAMTRVRGRYIGGFLTCDDNGQGREIEFRPYDRFRNRLDVQQGETP